MKDRLIALYVCLVALAVLGAAITAAIFMVAAVSASRPVEFSHECLDRGGRASYTIDEELVCTRAGHIIDRMEL